MGIDAAFPGHDSAALITVAFYESLADTASIAVDRIGAYFSVGGSVRSF